jgi:1-acyl-sn-glycerol-3-phosphate acyltransferase
MIRAAFTMITVFVVTSAVSFLCVVFSVFGSYSKIINYLAKFWTRSILFAAGVKLVIEGLEKVDRNKSYIFIGNHQSHFDVMAVFSALPLTARFMAKKELYKIPLFGWALAATGTIRIDRSNREKSIASMNNALERIKQGVSIAIFAEGTRSDDGNIKEFKKGGFVLAIKGGIPIVPLSVSGSRFILRKHSLKVTPGKIKMVFSDPIDTAKYSYQDRQKLSELTRNIILENFDKNYNES